MTDTTNTPLQQAQPQGRQGGDQTLGGNPPVNNDCSPRPAGSPGPSTGTDSENNPPLRVKETHRPELVEVLKKLSPRSRLGLNAEIGNRNLACERVRLDRIHNPLAQPVLGSDDESFVTICDEEWPRLSDPTVFDSYPAYLPIYAREELASRKKRSRDLDSSFKTDTSDSHRDKRRCIDGSVLRQVADSSLVDHPVSGIFYDTAGLKMFLPLHFFEALALVWALYHASEIRIFDSKPTGNKGDETRVLNIAWLTEKLDSDEKRSDFTFSRWLNASKAFLRFQSSRDT